MAVFSKVVKNCAKCGRNGRKPRKCGLFLHRCQSLVLHVPACRPIYLAWSQSPRSGLAIDILPLTWRPMHKLCTWIYESRITVDVIARTFVYSPTYCTLDTLQTVLPYIIFLVYLAYGTVAAYGFPFPYIQCSFSYCYIFVFVFPTSDIWSIVHFVSAH